MAQQNKTNFFVFAILQVLHTSTFLKNDLIATAQDENGIHVQKQLNKGLKTTYVIEEPAVDKTRKKRTGMLWGKIYLQQKTNGSIWTLSHTKNS